MTKTKAKHRKRQAAVAGSARGSAHWARCYLEHAARETAWASQNAKERNYSAAHDALVRREVWLYAALLAQEKSAPNEKLRHSAGKTESVRKEKDE